MDGILLKQLEDLVEVYLEDRYVSLSLALSHQHLEHLCQQKDGNRLDDVVLALVDVLVEGLDESL